MYKQTLMAGWGDMDFNSHMRNTAYLDKAADVRMLFFADNGFPMSEFMRLRLGPVVMKDEIEYFKEAHLLDPLTVNLAVIAMAEDGSRFRLCNEFFRPDGKMSARVLSTGGWLDLQNRKLIAPPETLLAAMKKLAGDGPMEILPSSIR